MKRATCAAAIVLTLGLIACERKPAPDAGVRPTLIDAGSPIDAGHAHDSGWPDAGPGLELFHNGRDLAGWMMEYWRWSHTGLPDAGREGDMVFLPLPRGMNSDGGSIYTGTLSLQLAPTDHFVLPLMAYIAESYLPDSGTPDDDETDDGADVAYLPPSMRVALTIDGVAVVQSPPGDLSLQFYGRQNFVPPIQLPMATSYGAAAEIWAKGIGVLHEPFAPGKHTIHLVEYSANRGHGYDNTWNITVPSPDAGRGLELDHRGKTLATWFKQYWAWHATGDDPDAGREGDVVYLPLPLVHNLDGGILYTGTLSMHLAPTDHFMLSLYSYVGERYLPDSGTPDDDEDYEAPDDDYLSKSMNITLTIDGFPVVKSPPGSLALLWTPRQNYTPPIVYESPSSYGAIAATYVKGFGILHVPFAKGKHTIHLVETNVNQKLAYDNTWQITVP
jgi:hypothetical protein